MLAGAFIGSFDTASNSLVLYMLGPDRSPPFTQSLHAMVGLGFMMGSLVIRPFLPEENEETGTVCHQSILNESVTQISNSSTEENLDIQELPNLIWPYGIVSIIHIVCSTAFLCLSK